MDQITGETYYVPFLTERSNAEKGQKYQKIRKSLLFGIAITIAIAFGVGFATYLMLSGGGEVPFASLKTMVTSPPFSSVPSSILPLEAWVDEHFSAEFSSFRAMYNRNYSNETEQERRFKIFRKNLTYIMAHNEQKFDFKLGMNQFGDLTKEEFSRYYANMRPPSKIRSQRDTDWSLLEVDPADLPTSLDWRARGCVTEVKDQEKCGSCWAFSTTGAVEGAVCAKTGALPDLSEQQLVDCAGPEGNLGCDGGIPDHGFQYVLDNKGLCQETSYPYKGRPSGYCKARKCENTADIRAFRDVPPKSELSVRAALSKYGPVSIALEADQLSFEFYKSGIFSAACGQDMDHATLLVGYGTDEVSGHDYFIMKNSWGSSWGENGYMRIRRKPGKHSHGGECGMLQAPAYALP